MKRRLLILFAALCAAGTARAMDIPDSASRCVLPSDTTESLASLSGMDDYVFEALNQQAYVGPEGKKELAVGRQVAMTNPVETAVFVPEEKNGGYYSIHDYCFSGVGRKHVTHSWGFPRNIGSDISCGWHVMWPGRNCGMSTSGLEKLRAGIMRRVFGWNFYVNEGWQPPKTMEGLKDQFRNIAFEKWGCADRKVEESYHDCSQWTFSADCNLTWPFGISWSGGEWYERPVICFKNTGYANDGGMGCHTFVSAGVYSIPDGAELDERDYFRADKMDELFALVWERLFRDNGLTLSDALRKSKEEAGFKPGALEMNVSREGMTWWVNAYTVFPGCQGVRQVTIPWKDLYPFLRNPADKPPVKYADPEFWIPDDPDPKEDSETDIYVTQGNEDIISVSICLGAPADTLRKLNGIKGTPSFKDGTKLRIPKGVWE